MFEECIANLFSEATKMCIQLQLILFYLEVSLTHMHNTSSTETFLYCYEYKSATF